MDTILTDLQEDIAARLRDDAVLHGIEVVTERTGDIAATVARAIGLVSGHPERAGLCIVVLQMTATPESVEVPFPVMELEPVVRVLESPAINGSGMTALGVARRIARVLHHWSPGGLTSCLTAESPAIVGVEDPIAPVAYDVQFRCIEATSGAWPKVAAPVIWPEEALVSDASPVHVTIACDTEDAMIWYTTDGTPPAPGNRAAAVYAAPLPIASATRVRAAAYRDDWIASDTAEAVFETPNT